MNRWDAPNGIVHIYKGNFLAADRHIWDPVTSERHRARLAEPLAPAHTASSRTAPLADRDLRPALAGTAFAAVTVGSVAATTRWMADALGLRTLTTQDDSCAIEQPYSYLIEPSSLTIVGLHATTEPQTKAGLEHIALRVPTMGQLESWQRDLAARGHRPSPITTWDFGTFVDITGPDALTIRLFVPAVR
jgi:Glyoxalase/Bleomycin resistance protein/Dioxygenase superfamily